MTPEIRLRPIRIPSREEPKEEEQQAQPAPAPVAESAPTSLRPLQVGQPKEEPQEQGKLERFEKGLLRSTSGELSGAVSGRPREEIEVKPESDGFWNSVIEESGNLVGDAPFIAIGGAIGGTLGTTLGATLGPAGALIGGGVGGSFGALAMPAFLKEASREYRKFQDSGGDLTFGEFLQSADKVANATLREGAFGVALGAINKGMGFLRKVPAIDKLFNTKYIGPVAEGTATLGAEVTGATTIPAAAEGRLPTAEDAARAAVLFAGQKSAHLPFQLIDAVKEARSERFNYALADKVQDLDLAYPPLQEFRKNDNPVYKNSVELDRNLTAFDQSYIDNMISRINAISSVEFPSAHEAGTEMRNTLGPLAAVEIPAKTPGTPEPVKPIERPVPLLQNMNPIRIAGEQISNAAPTKAELGRRITRQYEAGRQHEYEPLQQRYREQERETAGLDVVDQSVPGEVQEFIDRFEPGAIPGSQASTISANARLVRDLFVQYDEEGNIAGYRAVPMRRLIQVNRSIKQIPNWDVPPEMLDNLNTLTRQIDGIITDHLEQVNPDLATEYRELNADYALFKNRWDNADMRVFYDRTENSESVAKKFSNLDQFTQLAQAFEGTPQGDQVLNLIRREVWNDRFGRDAREARTEADFQDAMKDITDRDFNDVNEFLTPEQRARTLTAMQRSNQIRTSAIRSSEQFSQNKERYDQEMRRWKEQEASRKEKDKNLRADVQTKQDLLVSLLQEDPAKLVGNMHTIEGIKRIKDASNKVPEGDKLYDSLARYETEQMFNFMGEGYLRTGRVPYTELKLKMHDKEFRAKLKELNGEGFVKEMDQLVDIQDDLSKNFKEHTVKFKDDPTTLNTILHIYSILGLAQGNIMTPLMAFTAKKSILRVGNKAWNMWSGRRNFDQKSIHRVLNAARAVRSGNKEAIRKQEALLNIPYKLEG